MAKGKKSAGKGSKGGEVNVVETVGAAEEAVQEQDLLASREQAVKAGQATAVADPVEIETPEVEDSLEARNAAVEAGRAAATTESE